MNGSQVTTITAWGCLASSALLIFAAPAWMPDSYSAFRHSISESAAQGWSRALPVRLGLALLGVGAALASLRATPALMVWSLRVFALAMICSAIWSHRPWLPDLAFDTTEDRVHSWAAQTAGMAFVAAVLARMAQQWVVFRQVNLVDAIALFAALGVPMLWFAGFAWHGAAQRGMFLCAYVWLALETVGRCEAS